MHFIYDTKLFHDAIQIRNEVFVHEQGFQNEFDEIDDISLHFVLYDEKAVGVCRLYYDTSKQAYILGRLAMLQSHRHLGYGSKLVQEVEKVVKKQGGTSIHLHAQCVAIPFYQRLGFIRYGEIDKDENCPHQWMKKKFK